MSFIRNSSVNAAENKKENPTFINKDLLKLDKKNIFSSIGK